MTASPNLSHSLAIRKSGVLVLSGYGIRVQVNAGHLLLHDGIADERRTIRLPRVNHGLKRVVLIGSDGFVTLEALRWISDVQPLTPALELIRHELVGTAISGSAWVAVAKLAGFAAVLGPVSILAISRAIRVCTRRGTLIEY